MTQLYSSIPGTSAAIYAVALARARGDVQMAAEIVRKNYSGFPAVAQAIIKSAIPTAESTTAGWASELIDTTLSDDLAQAVRARDVLGRLSQVRRVPFQTIVPVETTGVSGAWAAEGEPIPVSKSAYDTVALPSYRGGVIVPMTREQTDSTSPGAIISTRQSFVRGVSSYFDAQFLDPSVALVANVSPASITNGATAVAGSGVTTAAGMAQDVAALVDAADDMVDPVWIMRATTCARMATTLQMPGIKIQNGELAGIPILCSKSVPAPVGSPSMPRLLVLLDQDAVLLADDGEYDVKVSTATSIQLESAPGSGPQNAVSMFQTESSVTRIIRRIAWQRTRATGVVYCEVAY